MGVVVRTISFEDLDGNQVEEDWWFTLDESDAAEMDLSYKENLQEYLEEIQKNRDAKELMHVMRVILFASVGKREGKMLVKNEEIFREFRYGGAYRQLFSELLESKDAGASFFTAIMPEKIQAKVTEKKNRTYTETEMLAMTDEEFAQAFGTDEKEWSREVLLVAMRRKTNKAA